MFNSDLYSDVTFILGKEEDEVVTANSFVLSVSSSVFAKMFNGGLSNEKSVKIPDASRDTFLKIIRFIYSGTVEISLANITDIMYLAKKYSISLLEKKCKEFAIINLSVNNVAELFKFAIFFEEKSLIKECAIFVRFDTLAYLQSDSFLFSEDKTSTDMILKNILSSDTLSCSESELCQFVLEYGAASYDVDDAHIKITNGGIIREGLESFHLLRFLTLSTEEFLEIVYKYTGMFSQEEIILIVMKLNLKKDLPPLDVTFSSDRRQVIPSLSSRAVNVLEINAPNGSLKIYLKDIEWKELKFSVKKNIFICGVGVFSKTENEKTKAFVKIEDSGDNIIAEQDGTNELAGSIFIINFLRPIIIMPNEIYKICIRYNEVGEYYNGTNQLNYKETSQPMKRSSNNVEFDFKENDGSFVRLYFKNYK